MPDLDPPGSHPADFVVEPPQEGTQYQLTERGLKLRIRQQEILAELGVVSLKRTPFRELLNRTVELAAEGLEAELCKVMEYIPEENRLLLRAGVGWKPGLIDVASVSPGLASPAGFALQTGRPVISNHLGDEDRFETPDLLRAHGVRRAINVIIEGDGAPFGVLEVDSRSEGEFCEQDISFLQGAANILGMAIERERYERNLREALDHQKLLVNEINHRVKNSLQLVASMFSLQAATGDTALAQSLKEAIARVTVVARIHERLYRSADILAVDLGAYLDDICRDLAELTLQSDVQFRPTETIRMNTDRAVRVALLVTELVTNAVKHAYHEGRGTVLLRLTSSGQEVVILSVRDEGSGVPADFDLGVGRGLGIKIINALVKQLGATLAVHRRTPGTEFVVSIPLKPATDT